PNKLTANPPAATQATDSAHLPRNHVAAACRARNRSCLQRSARSDRLILFPKACESGAYQATGDPREVEDKPARLQDALLLCQLPRILRGQDKFCIPYLQ